MMTAGRVCSLAGLALVFWAVWYEWREGQRDLQDMTAVPPLVIGVFLMFVSAWI